MNVNALFKRSTRFQLWSIDLIVLTQSTKRNEVLMSESLFKQLHLFLF